MSTGYFGEIVYTNIIFKVNNIESNTKDENNFNL